MFVIFFLERKIYKTSRKNDDAVNKATELCSFFSLSLIACSSSCPTYKVNRLYSAISGKARILFRRKWSRCFDCAKTYTSFMWNIWNKKKHWTRPTRLLAVFITSIQTVYTLDEAKEQKWSVWNNWNRTKHPDYLMYMRFHLITVYSSIVGALFNRPKTDNAATGQSKTSLQKEWRRTKSLYAETLLSGPGISNCRRCSKADDKYPYRTNIL